MTDRLKLGGNRTHDGDDDPFLELRIDGIDRLDPLHASSHIRSRPRSTATGLLADEARVSAFFRRAPTWSGESSRVTGIRRASSTCSVTPPPSVCQGSRSPNSPRWLINMRSGMR